MAFKQKGSPFQRNFGIGKSPMKATESALKEKESDTHSHEDHHGLKKFEKKLSEVVKDAQVGEGVPMKSPMKDRQGDNPMGEHNRTHHPIPDLKRKETEEAPLEMKSPMKDTKTAPDNGDALEADERHKANVTHDENDQHVVDRPLPMKSSGFKMKSSPFNRNFGIGESPLEDLHDTEDITEETTEDITEPVTEPIIEETEEVGPYAEYGIQRDEYSTNLTEKQIAHNKKIAEENNLDYSGGTFSFQGDVVGTDALKNMGMVNVKPKKSYDREQTIKLYESDYKKFMDKAYKIAYHSNAGIGALDQVIKDQMEKLNPKTREMYTTKFDEEGQWIPSDSDFGGTEGVKHTSQEL